MASSSPRAAWALPLHSPPWVVLSWAAWGFLLGGCAPAEEGKHPGPGPEALVQAWVELWNSYDLNQVSALFLDDPGLTYFSSEVEGLIRGMEAVLEHHRGFGFVPGGADSGNRLWLEEIQVDEFRGAAVVTAIWYFSSAAEDAGPAQRGPVTFVCVPGEDGWRFVHMNFAEYGPPNPS